MVVTDLRVLNAIGKRYELIFDKKYKYCISGDFYGWKKYKGNYYRLKYFNGCFYPFIVKREGGGNNDCKNN